MIQNTPRRRRSTSSLKGSSRDSPGTPTPNPRQSKDNSRLASSNATTQEHAAFNSTTNIPKVPQSLPSTLSSDEADDNDEECLMTSSDPEDSDSSNCSEHPVAKVYDQYDLNGFTPQDFDLLLTLAPADQLPDLTTSEVKAYGAPSLRDGRSATHTAIKRYVVFHKFNQEPYASHTISQRRAFERNVYDYARANGLGKQEALSEVYKARVIGGAPEDDDSDNSSFGPEVDDTSEILAHLAKTTFSYRDIEMERIAAVKEYEPQEPKGVNKDGMKTRRGRKTGGDKHNVVAETRKPVTGKANVEQAKSDGTEVPSRTGSVPVDKTRSSRSKRKRMDVEVAGDTMPPREAKKSRHFQRCDNEQSTTHQGRHSIDRRGGTMEADAPLEKYTNMQHTTPTLPKDTKKATRRQEKINRRREKSVVKSKEQHHPEIKEPREEQTSGADVAQLPSAKVVDAKPANSELLGPAEKKKRNRRKGKSRESESKAGASSSRPEGQATSKKLGPNDPKSEREAHQNFLNANIHDPPGSTLPADKTNREPAEAEEKQSNFIEKLDALKRFSNEKQLQLYEDGKYSNADKQTKDDLKDLKEEKTAIEEMDIDSRNVAKSPENKKKKMSTGGTVKRDKAAKDEGGGVEESGDIESTNVFREKNRKRCVETPENVLTNGQADFQ